VFETLNYTFPQHTSHRDDCYSSFVVVVVVVVVDDAYVVDVAAIVDVVVDVVAAATAQPRGDRNMPGASAEGDIDPQGLGRNPH